MKTSKKLLAFAICLVMLATLVPMAAFATGETLSIGTITKTAVVDNLFTVTVPYTAANVEQVTILALIGGDAEPTTYDNTTIAYIDQQPAATNITVDGNSVPGFQFVVDYTKFSATNDSLYIKMGGTALGSAVTTNPVLVVETVTKYKVFGYVAVTAVPATVTLAEGLISTTDGTGKFEITGADAGIYNLVISAKSALPRTIPVTITSADYEVSLNTNQIPLMFGDVDSTGKIDNNDLMSIKGAFNKASTAPEYSANLDLDNSGKIDNNDLMALKGYFNKTSSAYDAWTK